MIVEDKDVRFGKPCIAGTRITVQDIVESFYQAERSVEQIAEDFGIAEQDVEDALRYNRNTQQRETVTA